MNKQYANVAGAGMDVHRKFSGRRHVCLFPTQSGLLTCRGATVLPFTLSNCQAFSLAPDQSTLDNVTCGTHKALSHVNVVGPGGTAYKTSSDKRMNGAK